MAKKETFSRYDTADYLKSEDDIIAYLEAAAEENDPALMTHALGVIARTRNISELSRKTEISREGLYKAFSGEGNPSFATVVKVASALGFQVTFKAAV